MLHLWTRARAYQPLTPTERALLKLVEGLLCAALVAALPIVADALSRGSVNWGDVARAALASASVAVLLALAKYAKSQGDPQLAAALVQAGADLSPQAAPLSDADGQASQMTGASVANGASGTSGTSGASQPA